MIVGNAKATSPAEATALQAGHVFFKCGISSGTRLKAPPTSCSSSVISISFIFPNCWDGVRLSSPDQSHMAYPNNGCPASHPVNIPRVQAFFRYHVGPSPIGDITLASGPYYTAHADFFSGWRTEAMAWLTTNCINIGPDCGINPAVPV
jgi:hypothetical protein